MRHLAGKRKGALHGSQVEHVDRDDEARAKSCEPLCAVAAGGASSHRARRVMLEQLEQLRARSFRPLPTATGHDEGQARAGVLEAPFVIVVGITRPPGKKGARVVRADLRQAVEETATDPETYAADCAEVVERVVNVSRWDGLYVLVCSGYDDDRPV